MALGKLADTRAVGPLIKTLGEDAYSEVRRAAAEALDALGESTWKTLVQGDDDDWSRLGASGDARAAAPLIMLLWDDDGHKRTDRCPGPEHPRSARVESRCQGRRRRFQPPGTDRGMHMRSPG